jgi:hypothetical protein
MYGSQNAESGDEKIKQLKFTLIDVFRAFDISESTVSVSLGIANRELW